MRRAFRDCRCFGVALLQRREAVAQDLIAFDSAIELFLLTHENVAQFLHTALKMSDPDLKVIKSSGFGHHVSLCASGAAWRQLVSS
jgi:hypothetical protein